jgi:hypothetical protein
LTCDGGTIQKEWTNAMFMATGDIVQHSFVSADGRTAQGTVAYWLDPDTQSCYITSEWHFTAEREP